MLGFFDRGGCLGVFQTDGFKINLGRSQLYERGDEVGYITIAIVATADAADEEFGLLLFASRSHLEKPCCDRSVFQDGPRRGMPCRVNTVEFRIKSGYLLKQRINIYIYLELVISSMD